MSVSAGIDSRPQAGAGSSVAGATAENSVHWVTRLRRITGLTRLRLRVVYEPSDLLGARTANLATDPEFQRIARWVNDTRASMLINGNALGDEHIRVLQRRNSYLITVYCDDNWNPDTGEHEHIEEIGQEYDRDLEDYF